MDRIHFHFDDDSVGMLIEGPSYWEAWLRRPDGKLYVLRVLSDPWHLDGAQELAREALQVTQRILVQMQAGATVTGVSVPSDLPLLMETMRGAPVWQHVFWP